LQRWFSEFVQESDSQIWKNFGVRSGFKIFKTRLDSENVTAATSALHQVTKHSSTVSSQYIFHRIARRPEHALIQRVKQIKRNPLEEQESNLVS